MPNRPLRILAATALLAACSRSDAAARPETAATAGPATATAAGAPAAPRDSISDRADRGRILGDSTASVWLIMASDFQCPFCKTWHDTEFQKLVDRYVKTGRVRMAFLNLPLGMHQHALAAAEAAMCASVQGRFWQMHDAIFIGQKQWEALPDPTAVFGSLAAATGVNMDAWRQCVKQHLTLPLIQADRERVTAARVNSTPTFFVGDQILAGADANLAGAIEAALAKAGSGKKPPAS